MKHMIARIRHFTCLTPVIQVLCQADSIVKAFIAFVTIVIAWTIRVIVALMAVITLLLIVGRVSDGQDWILAA